MSQHAHLTPIVYIWPCPLLRRRLIRLHTQKHTDSWQRQPVIPRHKSDGGDGSRITGASCWASLDSQTAPVWISPPLSFHFIREVFIQEVGCRKTTSCDQQRCTKCTQVIIHTHHISHVCDGWLEVYTLCNLSFLSFSGGFRNMNPPSTIPRDPLRAYIKILQCSVRRWTSPSCHIYPQRSANGQQFLNCTSCVI